MIVGILGCGPSGLIARHAVERAIRAGDVEAVRVYSRKVPSAIWGAQYLHRPIPEVPGVDWDDSEPISYTMTGEPEQYLRKVYGTTWDGTISDDLRDQAHLAWDLRKAYGWLWQQYGPAVVNQEVPEQEYWLKNMHHELTSSHDLVINTIPRPTLCWAKHDFVSTSIWALGQDDDRPWPMKRIPVGSVYYDGEEETAWYRLSNLFGYHTAEWPSGAKKPPVQGVAQVRKPLRHNCDCFPLVYHLGRMGRWANGYLAHDVYYDTLELLDLKKRGAL